MKILIVEDELKTADYLVRGLRAGADDYLIKPFSFLELLARLQALTRRGRMQEATQIEIEDLKLDLAARKASRGGQRLELTAKEFALRVEDEIAKALDFLELILDEAGVSARVDGTAVARLERALFQRAVMNLLHNAVQHSPPGSAIAVRIERDEARVAITVANPGPPLAEAHLARVFDRFFRVDSARGNSGENHGLGLSIVKAVAVMHGGEAFARREGSCNVFGFTVRAQGPAAAPASFVEATTPFAAAPDRA